MATTLTGQHDHRRRFGVLIGLLVAVLAAAVVATVVLARRDRPAPWSDFTAVASDPVRRADLIAGHVQDLYRDDRGDPLLTITAGEDFVSDVAAPTQTVAVGADYKGAPFSFESQNILFYRLCGPADDCGFGDGADSSRQLTLASRAAWELALRGFKDVPEATAVIAVMPPGFLEMSGPADKQPDTVFYFRRDDVSAELHRRLRSTVPAPVAPSKLTEKAIERTRDALTPSLYTMRVASTSDTNGVTYELTPPPMG